MVRLRRLLAFPHDPPRQTAMSRRFEGVVAEVADEVTSRVAGVDLPARYRVLAIVVDSVPQADGRVHWRFEDAPTFEFEQARVSLPIEAPGWPDDRLRAAARAIVHAALTRMEHLLGWPPGSADRLAALARGGIDVPIVFDPAPAIHIWAGGGSVETRPARLYLQRNDEHALHFRTDPAWWAWWLAVERREVGLLVTLQGRVRLTVAVTEAKVGLHRVRPDESIPVDEEAARALADRDLEEALARLVRRLDLAPHPPLR